MAALMCTNEEEKSINESDANEKLETQVEMEGTEEERSAALGLGGGHILVLSYPTQGHINPMLQFSKRLSSKGIKITLAITIQLSKTIQAKTGSIEIDTISDGFDDGEIDKAHNPALYLDRFKIVGSKTLAELIEKLNGSGNPISCLVYDSFLPWALDVAKQFNLDGASFFTQSCAVSSVYYYLHRGLMTMPVSEPVVSIPGLPELRISDLPTFVSDAGTDPVIVNLLVDQFSNIGKDDWVLINTFDQLEDEVLNWMRKLWRVRTIGPTVPSAYLDKRIESDQDYGLSIFEPKRDICINWLNTKADGSVVYVSFGSLCALKHEEMEEVAMALSECSYNFLWVVRATEESKLPSKFLEETSMEMNGKGLVVSWCPQLEVLSHRAIGCFVTHCGWNSTLEALSLGVPMIGLAQWSDQPMNAKCIDDWWKVGVRVKVEEGGSLKRKELEECIKEVMDGLKGKEMKKNASRWKELTMEAVNEGGSSDTNIEEFVANVVKQKKVEMQGIEPCTSRMQSERSTI